MIAQCATKPGPSIDQMIDFVIAGCPRATDGRAGFPYKLLRIAQNGG
jgi:hypothetical protein